MPKDGPAQQDVFTRHATPVNVPQRPPSLGRMNTLASRAEHLAQALLQEPLPRRWGARPGRRRAGPQPGTRPRR
jgi:hypothetical protein